MEWCKAGKVIKDGFTVRTEPVMWRRKGIPVKYCTGMAPNTPNSCSICDESCKYYKSNAERDCKTFVNECIHSGELVKYRLPERPDLVSAIEKASGKYFDALNKEKLKTKPESAIRYTRENLMAEVVMWLKYVTGISNEGIWFLFGLYDKEIRQLEAVGLKNIASHYIHTSKCILGGLMDVPDEEEWEESVRRERLCFLDEQRATIQQYLSKCSKDTSVKYTTQYRNLPYPQNLIADLLHANGLVSYPELDNFFAQNSVIDTAMTCKNITPRQSNVLFELYVRGVRIATLADTYGTYGGKITNIRDKAFKEIWREFTYPV